MSKFELYKFIHVAAAIVWIGGSVVGTIWIARLRKADLGHRLGLARDIEFLGPRVFGVVGILALLFGILMVVDADAYGFGDTWILIGLIGIALSLTMGFGYLEPQSKKFRDELEAGNPGDAPLSRITSVSYVDTLLLLVIVWAMVFKPGG